MLQSACFATEKYDGTNIAKDDEGHIYSRRFPIDDDQEMFIKTNLKKVKEANVPAFRDILVEDAGLDKDVISKFIVYGEFICNDLYDYGVRGLLGSWRVFGAKLELKNDASEVSKKLREAGFAIPLYSKKQNQVKICPNQKFFEMATKVNLDVPEIMAGNDTIANVIEMNKVDMKRGQLEGIVLTVQTEEFGVKILKWKGSQEFQPMAHQNFLETNERIQKSNFHDTIKMTFNKLSEVVRDLSENALALKMYKDKEPKIDNDKDEASKIQGYLTFMDKEIISQGILHSQKKFDSVEHYHEKGQEVFEEYTFCLIEEVRKHLAEEKERFVNTDNNESVMQFIEYKVRGILKGQVEHLNTFMQY